MDLVLIRHPAVAVPPGQCYGRSDVPLLDTAAAGATAIAAKLARLGIGSYALHSSPLRRCMEVARALAQRPGDQVTDAAADAAHGAAGNAADDAADSLTDTPPALAPDPRLAELDFGDWEGRRWDDVPRAALDAWAADIEHAAPHGGESVAQLAARTDSWLSDIGARATATGAATVVLTHAGVIRVMTARALSLPTLTCLDWTLQMTGICRLSRARTDGRWSLALWNG
ncbi:histidine phosphatase family protein [Robbsia sp. Bb-Pol-6]|uniref:Histidine phosphatase family protein n=1 Tax=Robbsia betulipollinis TaxID=2981849 RepID=A0ABT3ZRB4_9BURK|nr:histidine phosphatase family protein [Robbsia betulipollinis]MCY0389098.1 histidine phosphatase family protein [Robbsia betulipollinis]